MKKLAFVPVAVLLLASRPARAASACDAVIAALNKVYQVPVHLYMTDNGGKTRIAETIYLNGTTFVMVNNRKWRKSTVSPKDLAEAQKDSDQKLRACSAVRDEVVGGEIATLYKAHYQTPEESVDGQIWISRSRGVPLKQSNDIDVGGGAAGKRHTDVRYEYTNVAAPSVVEPTRK